MVSKSRTRKIKNSGKIKRKPYKGGVKLNKYFQNSSTRKGLGTLGAIGALSTLGLAGATNPNLLKPVQMGIVPRNAGTVQSYQSGPFIPSWNNWQGKVINPLGKKVMKLYNNYSYSRMSPEEQKKYNNQKAANKAEVNAWKAEIAAEQKAEYNAVVANFEKWMAEQNAKEATLKK
jgi:hypothetical protein